MKITFDDMKGLNAPQYCRKIMKKEEYPLNLEIYRGDMLCLSVDVVKMSKLTLVERSRGFFGYEPYKPFKRWLSSPSSGSPIDLNEVGATHAA